jgi:hypothetical protein
MPSIYSSLVEDNPQYNSPEIQKGLEGLDYLTGVKHKQTSTFAEDHPVQAVVQDVASYGPTVGLLGGAGVGAFNLYSKYKDTKKLDEALTEYAHRTEERKANAPAGGNKGKNGPPPYHPVTGGLLDRHDLSDPAIAEQRLQVLHDLVPDKGTYDVVSSKLDNLRNTRAAWHTFEAAAAGDAPPHVLTAQGTLDPAGISEVLNALGIPPGDHAAVIQSTLTGKPAPAMMLPIRKQVKEKMLLLQQEINSDLQAHPAAKHLPAVEDYAGLLDVAKRSSTSDILGGSVEDLAAAKRHELYSALIKAQNASRAELPVSQQLQAKVLKDDELAKMLSSYKPPSKLMSLLPYVRRPALIGAGVAAGGYGLSKLLSLLHDKMYGSEKMQEYKRNLLATKGQFQDEQQQ